MGTKVVKITSLREIYACHCIAAMLITAYDIEKAPRLSKKFIDHFEYLRYISDNSEKAEKFIVPIWYEDNCKMILRSNQLCTLNMDNFQEIKINIEFSPKYQTVYMHKKVYDETSTLNYMMPKWKYR